MTDQKEIPAEYVATVSVKLRDLWTEDPDLWFLHAEAAYRNAQITKSKTKFDHIVHKLPRDYGLGTRPDHGLCCVVELRTAEAHHQTAIVKLQVHQTLSVISTNVLVLQPTIVALLAVSRETPEPMGGGKIKQPLSRFYGYLVYLQDALSNRDYLMDTGASRSVFPHRSSAATTGPRLLMADGRPTKAWGSRLIPLVPAVSSSSSSWEQISWQSLTS